MTTNLGSAVLELSTDDRGLNRGLRTAERGTDSFIGRLKQARLGLLSVAAAGTGLVVLGKQLIEAASDAEEMRNKFEATFGQSTPEARAELDEFGRTVGRGRLELQGMAADVGAVLKSAGLMEDQAASLSVDLTKLATDVASFTNANDADVLRAFSRALTGEREALKTYGISVLEAEVQQKALAMGFETIDGQLSASDKALATYQLLLDKTTDSQGDATRTADSYANQTRNLGGAIKDLSASLGQFLVPAATNAAGNLTVAARALDDFAQSLAKVGPQPTAEQLKLVAEGDVQALHDLNRERSLHVQALRDEIKLMQDEGTITYQEYIRLAGQLTNAQSLLRVAQELLNEAIKNQPEPEAPELVGPRVLTDLELAGLEAKRTADELQNLIDTFDGQTAGEWAAGIHAQRQEMELLAAVTEGGDRVLAMYWSGQLDAAEAIRLLNELLDEQGKRLEADAIRAEQARLAQEQLTQSWAEAFEQVEFLNSELGQSGISFQDVTRYAQQHGMVTDDLARKLAAEGIALDDLAGIMAFLGLEIQDIIAWEEEQAEVLRRMEEAARAAAQAQRELAQAIAETSGSQRITLPATRQYVEKAATDLFESLSRRLTPEQMAMEGLPKTLSGFISFFLDSVNQTMKAQGLGRGEAMMKVLRSLQSTFMASGGIVTRPTLATIGERGPEAVIPLSKLSGMIGGMVVNFNGPIYGFADFQDKVGLALRDRQLAGGYGGVLN